MARFELHLDLSSTSVSALLGCARGKRAEEGSGRKEQKRVLVVEEEEEGGQDAKKDI